MPMGQKRTAGAKLAAARWAIDGERERARARAKGWWARLSADERSQIMRDRATTRAQNREQQKIIPLGE